MSLYTLPSAPVIENTVSAYRQWIDETLPSWCRGSAKILGDSPAAEKNHHAYPYGLLLHTWEVMYVAEDMSNALGLDTEVVVAAAFWHDYGKTLEYSWCEKDDKHPNGIEKTPVNRSHGHIVLGYQKFFEGVTSAMRTRIGESRINHVSHCILSHHGRKEWGSPVEPASPEALILHTADMYSAFYGWHRERSPFDFPIGD